MGNALKNTLIDIGRGSHKVEKKRLKENRYGILGLLDIIQGGDPNKSILSLGLDLKEISPQTSGSDGNMYANFASPWTNDVSSKTPPYFTPSCYMIPPPALKAGHLKKFNIQSLFYVFYAMPRDILAIYVSKELYRRKWMYNKQVMSWFIQEDGKIIQYFDTKSWTITPYSGGGVSLDELMGSMMSLNELHMEQQQQQQQQQRRQQQQRQQQQRLQRQQQQRQQPR